jgi:lysophospholipase L1-like esterase
MQTGGDLRSAGATLLCDLQQLSVFNDATDQNNTTYYNADRIHLTDAGYAQVAAAYKAALNL